MITVRSPWMGPSQGKRLLLRGTKYGFDEILANEASQGKLNNLNYTSCFYFQTDFDASLTTSLLLDQT